MRRTVVILAPTTFVLAFALAACGSSSKSSSSSPTIAGQGTRTIALSIKKDGCAGTTQTLAAGPATFTVKNEDGEGISELELEHDDKIVAESEALTPGKSGTFSLTLNEGTYTVVCPGGARGTITVTAVASGTTVAPTGAAAGTAAVDQYKKYVEDQTALLVTETQKFVDAVKAGDVAAAKKQFPIARAPYEAIEPIAESFGDLDPDIDAREGDVPDNEWGGFHRIEKQLWVNGNTTGMTPVADKLMTDVNTLKSKIPGLELEPARIANGSVELLNEVSKSKVTGEEDRYSHTDLSDFEANVLGAQAGFDAVKPIVNTKDEALVGQVDTAFAATLAALAKYKSGDSYQSYTSLSKADTQALAANVDKLADQLAKVGPLVVNG